jgi:hypothetical protein
MSCRAAGVHFFERHREDVERIIQSIKFKT